MSSSFPMFRMATLLAKQMSSPFATRIKKYAKTHPVMSQKLCDCANLFRNTEYKYKLWTLQLSGVELSEATKNAKLPPLSPTQAIEIGADLLGEIVIFILGAAILMFELNRQAEKQEKKEQNEQSRVSAAVMSLDEFSQKLATQQEELNRMYAALLELKNRGGSGAVKSGNEGIIPGSSTPIADDSSPLCTPQPPRSTSNLPDCPLQPTPQSTYSVSPASSPLSDKVPMTDVGPTIMPEKRQSNFPPR